MLAPDKATIIPRTEYASAIETTYVKDNIKACLEFIFEPCPTIKPVNIGIIGNTHGVKPNNNPPIKKSKTLANIDSSYNCLLIVI